MIDDKRLYEAAPELYNMCQKLLVYAFLALYTSGDEDIFNDILQCKKIFDHINHIN